MLPKIHLILGLIFALVFLLVFPNIGINGFLIIWASSVLIDIDHYLFYVWLKKDFNLKRSFEWFMRKNRRYKHLSQSEKKLVPLAPCLLHGIECLLILFFIYILTQSQIILFILIGFLFHEFLDLINLIYLNANFNHILSQTRNVINFRKRIKNKLAQEIYFS